MEIFLILTRKKNRPCIRYWRGIFKSRPFKKELSFSVYNFIRKKFIIFEECNSFYLRSTLFKKKQSLERWNNFIQNYIVG